MGKETNVVVDVDVVVVSIQRLSYHIKHFSVLLRAFRSTVTKEAKVNQQQDANNHITTRNRTVHDLSKEPNLNGI